MNKKVCAETKKGRVISCVNKVLVYINTVPAEVIFILAVSFFIIFKWSFLEFTLIKNSEAIAEAVLYLPSAEIGIILAIETLKMTIYSAVFLLIPVTAAVLLPKKYSVRALFLWNVLLTLVVYGDILHIRHFGSYMSIFKIELAPQLFHVADSILPLIRPADIFIFIDFILLVPLARRALREKRAVPLMIRRAKLRAAAVIFVLSILLATSFDIVRTAYLKCNDLYNTQNMGLAAGSAVYHGADVVYFIKDRMEGKAEMTPEEEKDFNTWYKNLSSMEKSDIKYPYSGIGKGKNLIVIQVESLQGFVVGMEINDVEITPNINRLLKKSIYFPDIYDQTMSGGTSDTEFMINTGLYPTPDTTVFSHHSDSSYVSLPAKLKKKGYGSYVFHADRKDFWNRDEMYKVLQYDGFFHRDHYIQDERIGLGLSDESFFRQTLDMMKELKQPFYASVITLTSHTPFDSPEVLRKTPNELSFLGDSFMHNYLKNMNYVDSQVGMFIKGLEKEGLLKDTLLVITGDHSAIPLEYKNELYDLLGISFNPAIDYVIWRNLHKVPLIVILPDPWNENIAAEPRAGGQIDILPTLAYLMGLKFPLLMGNNLLGPGHGSIVLRTDNSYIIDKILVLPDKGVAVNMETGEYKVTSGGEMGVSLQRSLKYNDYIIKKNLFPILIRKQYEKGREKAE